LLAIFPRAATPSDAKRINNETTNKLLAKFDGFWNIRYLDINKKFLEPDGTLSARIMGDRLHPAAVGYQIWADAIVPEIKVALAK
jgi:lysophospholipase L1-like esterase